jgi:hypothetical protein
LGFAEMLRKLIQQNVLPELPFLKK